MRTPGQPFSTRSLPAVLVALLVVSPAAAQQTEAPARAASQRVAEVRVRGNERTRAETILREMGTQVGSPYDSAAVEMDRDRIDNLGLFSDVSVDTLRLGPDVILDVRVKERLVWIPTEWIPYPILLWDDETGWSYGGGITNPNESGRNRTFRAAVQAGGERRLALSLSDPWVAGDHASVDASFLSSEYEDYEGRTDRWTSGGLGLGTYLGPWGRARLTLTVSEIETDPWRTASGTRRDRIRTLGAGLARDTRDVYADPRGGSYAGISCAATRPVLGGTVDYTSWQVDLRRYAEPRRHHVLAAAASAIYRDSPAPDYRLLRLGGFDAVRGLAPVSLRGRSRILGSVEYRAAVFEKRSYDLWFVRNLDLGLMVALFADAGAVWDGARAPRRQAFYGSVGCGLRILSQEIVRLEVAWSRRDGTQWIGATAMPF
jgi:outer membrane protein assembly factor BamA